MSDLEQAAIETFCAHDRKQRYLDGLTTEAIRAVLALAVEECARVAEDHGKTVSNEPIGKACSSNIASAIRSLIPAEERG